MDSNRVNTHLNVSVWGRCTAGICLGLLLAACAVSDAPPQNTVEPPASTPLPTAPTPSPAEQRYPDILAVEMTPEDDGEFTFAVTVSSPYDTPERYADAWRVLAPDGAVLGERELLHDHADEQPFTRILRDVRIPEHVTHVTVQGRDKVYGYGGTTMTVPVPGRAEEDAPATPTVTGTDEASDETGAFTYQNRDGNRLVGGRGSLSSAAPIDIPLAGLPQWVVANATAEGSLWATVLEDGTIQAFAVADGAVTEVDLPPGRMAAGTPPLLTMTDGAPQILTPPADASPLTHPVVLGAGSRLAYISTGGDLVLHNGTDTKRLALDALPDARVLVDERERLLLLAGASDRYAHGVLGDALEATRVVLVATQPELRIAREIVLDAPQVVEGIAPLWADLDGDGTREIIVTVSDARQGAQVVVYDEAGYQVATGPAIGRGGRWRHQIAAGPFAPDGSVELVAVRTPHLGGIVEFYARRGADLEIVAELPGYTSHVLGSRNLDMAVAADINGDRQAELLLPSQDRTQLAAIGRVTDGAQVQWTAQVGAPVSTNLAALRLPDGQLALGVGRADGVLRLWLSSPYDV